MSSRRDRDEEVLQQAEETLRASLDHAPDAIYMTDLKGVFLYGNRKAEELTGYKKEELIGMNFLESNLLSSIQLSNTGRLLALSLMGKPTGPDELKLTRKDGSAVWVEINTARVTQRKRGMTIGFVRDISERKQVERALEAESDRIRGYLQVTGSAVVMLDADGRVGLVNRRVCEILGYSEDEIMGKLWFESFLPVHTAKDVRVVFDRLMAGEIEADESFENPVITSSGEERLIAWHNTVLRENGKIVGTLSSGEDITERTRAREQLEASYGRIEQMLKGMLLVIERMTETRDAYTSGHQRRVAELSTAIALQMGLPEETCVPLVDMAARIHDIGKIAVPAEILARPGKLSDVEFSLIKVHPQIGYDILKSAELPYPVAEAVLQHHERLDGSGYPQGLSGEDILPEAQILMVADVVEAMSSHRPYRPALDIAAALEEVSSGSGIRYNPDVVVACLELFREKGFVFSS